jgi:hypothetical protein
VAAVMAALVMHGTIVEAAPAAVAAVMVQPLRPALSCLLLQCRCLLLRLLLLLLLLRRLLIVLLTLRLLL